MTESVDPHVWMIRTTENVLSGPYTRPQLVQLIEEEKLELTDEICRGNGYWIFLHEEQEIKKQLGIEVPAALVQMEEPTQTETDTLLLRASQEARDARSGSTVVPSSSSSSSSMPSGAAMGARAQHGSTVSSQTEPGHGGAEAHAQQKDDEDEIPELAVSADSIEDHTSVLSNRAFRSYPAGNSASNSTANSATDQAADAAGNQAASHTAAQDADTPPMGTEGPAAASVHPAPMIEVNGVSLVGLPKSGRWIVIIFSFLVASASVYFVYRRLRH